jgi:hypothetical protein
MSGDILDVRNPAVMLWLPCLWLIKMHEAQADFLLHLVADSTAPELTVRVEKYPPTSPFLR